MNRYGPTKAQRDVLQKLTKAACRSHAEPCPISDLAPEAVTMIARGRIHAVRNLLTDTKGNLFVEMPIRLKISQSGVICL